MSRIAEHYMGDGYGYPKTPGFKEHTTSRDAADQMKRSAENLRGLVLAAYAEAGTSGLTADEVAAKLDMSPFAVRPRVTELGPKHFDKLEKTGERRRNGSGMKAAVWRAKVRT